MKFISIGHARPRTLPCNINTELPKQMGMPFYKCCTLTLIANPDTIPLLHPPSLSNNKSMMRRRRSCWDTGFVDPVRMISNKIGKRWKEYQGIRNWEGLLDPLDDSLRGEILRYGHFVEAAYRSFDFDRSSPTYASCRFPKGSLLEESGFVNTGYRPTKHLRATSGIQLPRWVGTQSSWIGYVAVCHDKSEISRLGRRDVVIAFRGTGTCLEWLENLRATLKPTSPNGPMVESGFLSLYTSRCSTGPSLRDMVREEIKRLLQSYGHEPLSLTLTGHSLGAALATLTAYDINTTFSPAPLVTVISFGGPRVGNRSLRQQLEKQGTKVLRIVNSDDVVTKLPGFVVDEANERDVFVPGMPSQWVYAEIGRELRLSSKDCPYINSVNVATCHELKTYLQLVDCFVSSSCPFRATTKRVLGQPKTKRGLRCRTSTIAPNV